jgi:putative ABC transport system ATP-binding protein
MEEDAEDISSPLESSHTLRPEIIRCINISKEYEIGEYIVKALDSITFDVYRGEFVVFQGPSGAGKSTLLSLISGLDSPSKGSIMVEWVKISDLSEESMSIFRIGTIGFIFQNYNLISSLTAEENILFPMQLAQVEYKIQEERSKMLLDKIGLKERSEHLPFQLSAGEQQRVGIARALANDPSIVLADEPTANLDKKTSKIISDLLADLNKEGKTIVVASHDPQLIKLAHRVFSIEDGKIIHEKKIRDPPNIEEMEIPENYRLCVHCGRYIPPTATACGFCGVVQPKKE